jgi:hypothetical protein
MSNSALPGFEEVDDSSFDDEESKSNYERSSIKSKLGKKSSKSKNDSSL